MAESTIRQRPTKHAEEKKADLSKTTTGLEGQGRVISLLDVIRVLVTLVIAGVTVSYYTTSGESFIYGYKPWFLNVSRVKAWYRGPLELTLQELAKYDGNSADLPIYIAVNGTIYDVSNGRRMYGPGGSYNVFAGRDASRAFVTGCFQEDRTHDMRGVEEVYLPIEDVPNENISSADRKNRAAKERREAKQRAYNELKHWVDFFANSPKYMTVGKVVGLPEPKGTPPKLCEYAQKGRPKRSAQIAQKAAAAGSSDDSVKR